VGNDPLPGSAVVELGRGPLQPRAAVTTLRLASDARPRYVVDMPQALPIHVLAAVPASNAAAVDPQRLAAMLRVTLTELADFAGLHRSSLSRNPNSPEIQGKLGLLTTILTRAAEVGGGTEKAVLWFRHQPIAALGYARPADLTAAGEGKVVLQYLDALEHGAYA